MERRPTFGMVFLAKYSFDNMKWYQFWAEYAQEHGSFVTFFGCRAKATFADPFTGACKAFYNELPDIPLDGNTTRTICFAVRRPLWFDIAEEDAKEACTETTGFFHIPDLNYTSR